MPVALPRRLSLCGNPKFPRGAHFLALALALEILGWLGIFVASHKTEGPSTTLVFLGIMIDTQTFELGLPGDKLTRLQALLQTWSGTRSCTKKELESLLGHLSHAATVIVQCRTFLRQLFPLLALDRVPQVMMTWALMNQMKTMKKSK